MVPPPRTRRAQLSKLADTPNGSAARFQWVRGSNARVRGYASSSGLPTSRRAWLEETVGTARTTSAWGSPPRVKLPSFRSTGPAASSFSGRWSDLPSPVRHSTQVSRTGRRRRELAHLPLLASEYHVCHALTRVAWNTSTHLHMPWSDTKQQHCVSALHARPALRSCANWTATNKRKVHDSTSVLVVCMH